MLSFKRQTKEHIIYESINMKFENRQNESLVIETKPPFAFVGSGTGQDMTWEGAWESILGLRKCTMS